MSRSKDEGYDWINDPFDESKNAEDQLKMSKGSKTAILVAVVAVIVVFIVLVVVGLGAFSSLLAL